MKSKQHYAKRQSGMTLVELALALVVLGIVGAILAPVFESVVAGVEADGEAKLTQNEFSDLKSKWRRGPYTGLNNSYVIAARIPDPATVSGTSITNSWGQNKVWAAGTLTGGVANGAKQLTNPVPPEACLSYSTQMAPFVDQLIIGSTTVKSVGGTINETAAATACNVTTNTVNVIMRKS